MANTKIAKRIKLLGNDCGVIGTPVEGGYKVGDAVLWSYQGQRVGVGVICKERGNAYIMGLKGHSLTDDEDYRIVKLIIPSHLMNNELLQSVQSKSFSIEETEIEELTLDELRKRVPFEFVLKEEE